MTRETKHSELPFYFREHENLLGEPEYFLSTKTFSEGRSNKDNVFFIGYSNSHEEQKENLIFLAKAANNFYPLLEALKELRETVKSSGLMNEFKYDALGAKVNAAIKAAEESELK